jgi:uncharacterized protein YcbX
VRLSALALYPVKGAAAVAAASAELDALGLVGDRRFCLATTGGRVFTQRDDASLARLRASIGEGALRLDFDGEALEVPLRDFSREASIRVWSRDALAHAAGGDVEATLSHWFSRPLRLARLCRPVEREGALLAFGDAAALLVTNSASLEALNAHLDFPVPMDRFRPNLVVADAPAFGEDAWRRLRIGDAVLAPVHACGRCEVTTIDQALGAGVSGEPLRTLSRLRTQEGEAVFGVRYAVERAGVLRVGDEVSALPQ